MSVVEQLRFQQTKPLRPRPMLHWHQANPNLCRWLLLRKDLLQEVHRLITARKQPRIIDIFRQIGKYMCSIITSVHRQADMNGINNAKQCAKDRKFLRIEKIESIHPQFGAAQKWCINELHGETLHPIGVIGQSSLHAGSELIHDRGEFRQLR